MQPDDVIDKQRKGLPIYSARKRLVKELNNRTNVILIGETGCGKTTQVPQYIYQAQLNKGLMIACTQPRRVAAITIATRVAQEMRTELGSLTGYCVRFDDCTNPQTKIKYMTDGMLLRESVLDPMLKRYSFVILDEAHERTLHTDVLFGICKRAQARRKADQRPPLKIVVMSATMDADQFSRYFQADVLYLEGRSFEVECFYTGESQPDYVYSSMVTALQIHRTRDLGEDILIFLTGEEEIEAVVKTLREVSQEQAGPKLLVYPMYSKLASEAQLRVFNSTPEKCRKCIVATNIAETSVTIAGIQHVIDSGMVKSKSYNAHSGLDVLKVSRISKAQAWQRLGRAGRISSGSCYRLYTEVEFDAFRENTIPEILRSNLASVILQLFALGVDDIKSFDFMDKPTNESVESAVQTLELLGAIDDSQNITPLGRKMSAFPLDPRMSKALISAHTNGCLEEILSIISMLSVDTAFISTRSKQQECQDAHRKFLHSEGDHLTLLNVYRSYKGSGGSKEWCSRNFLNQRNLKSAMDVRKQLKELSAQNDLVSPCSSAAPTNVIRKTLLAGYFQSIAELQVNNQYKLVIGSKTVSIHPSSALFQCKPQYLLYNELVQTSKCYMRNVSMIEETALIEVFPEPMRRKLQTPS
ncbi:ATP-dependent RNA helicase DHX33-like [Watersipora subatra]|uniref:ATP-dependent RNA helicase DHX33-like n=1 Tax=Watersipora subatra TaxID=2589382 RepID=UPI00355B4958